MAMWFKELWQLIMMVFGSKPSDQEEVVLMQMRHFPFSGFGFMMWCGKMIYREEYADAVEKSKGTTSFQYSLTHETIHLRQAQAKGSWVGYYWKYFCEWVKGNPVIYPAISAYYTIPFEMEAYGNERDVAYPDNYTGDYLPCYDIADRKKTYKANKDDWRAYCRSIEKTEQSTLGL